MTDQAKIPDYVIDAMAAASVVDRRFDTPADGIRAALQAAEALGWVMVPKEPTPEQLKAAAETKAMKEVDSCIVIAALHGSGLPPANGAADVPLAHAYRAMISAAPSSRSGE